MALRAGGNWHENDLVPAGNRVVHHRKGGGQDTQNRPRRKGVRYNATFSRLYRDDDNWKSTESFGRDGRLLLSKVADQTHSWIRAQNREDETAAKAIAS